MIEAFIGPNGAGKTTAALAYARRIAAKEQVDIWSNVESAGVKLIENYDQLSELRHCIVILDEILAIAGSRESRSLPRKIQLWLTTLRHSDVLLIWTSPTFERADILLREVTRMIHYVKALATTKSADRLWRDTTISIVLSRPSSDGEPRDGLPSKIRMMRTYKHFGTFESHGDVSPFE